MSSTQLLKRLAAMDRHELWFRASTAGRRHAERVAYLARRPRWRRSALAEALVAEPLAAEGLSMHTATARLQRGDWMGAHEALMHHFATRRSRFVLAPAVRPQLARAVLDVHPGACTEAVRLADRVAGGKFDLLGYKSLMFCDVSDGEQIDWHFDPVHRRRAPQSYWSQVPYLEPAIGDHKVVWELNRHQGWLQLGRAYWLTSDDRYRDAFIGYLESWMRANPPLSGVNWASMLELALRSISWVWALHFFALDGSAGARDRSPWSVDLLLGLDRQLTLVERNLSRYFSPNTHLLGEALALYVAGRALPELRRAARWEQLGRSVLVEQVGRQIEADGGHAERSTHYHRYTLDFYLLALAIAQRTADPQAGAFADAASRLAHFARTMSDDHGRLPGIGDDDGGSLFPVCGRPPADVSDSLQLAAHLLDRPALAVGPTAEEVTWITGIAPVGERTATAWPSAALPATGYFVSRSASGDHLTIDAGRHGFLNGGHAHADALAVTLTVRGRPFLIDPGTGCYTVDPAIRDRFRSTRYHNTLTIDGRSQSVPAGPFHWRSTASATALEWRHDQDADVFEGVHDGYTPVLHHRVVHSRPGCWFIVDRVLGPGTHAVEAHWHIDPSWDVARTGPRTVRARHGDGTTVWLLSLRDDCEVFHGSTEEALGWCAPLYGPLVATAAIRVRRVATAPSALVTVIVEASEEPALEDITGDPAHEGTIRFEIAVAARMETVVVARQAGQPAGATSRPGGQASDGFDRHTISVERVR